jgi:hypothetical protein
MVVVVAAEEASGVEALGESEPTTIFRARIHS